MNLKKGFLFIISLSILSLGARAQNERIKALFIYNFTKYIEWPAAYKQGDFIIAVVGETAVFDQLVTNTATRKVATQSIVVKKYNKPKEVERCNILYMAHDKAGTIKEAVERIKDWNTLLITDSAPSGNLEFGLNFVNTEGKQTFEVNTSFLDQKKLGYNQELLRLGVKVK